jgi:carbohydrate-selective porin OprB
LGLGLIVIDASSGYLAGLADPADREINIELTYFAQLTEEIALQPDVQWIMSPAVDGGIEDTLVFGLRLSVGRTWEIR